MRFEGLKIKRADPETDLENKDNYEIFWFSEPSSRGPKWKVDHRKFIGYLQSQGFRRFDIGKDYIFIGMDEKVIDEVTITYIQDEIIKYINELDKEILEETGIERETLLYKFYASPGTYFNERKLSMLGPEPDLTFNKDTKEHCFIYYQNGFVRCSADGYQLQPYSKLDNYIFKNQLKDRKFEKHSADGIFKKFVLNIAGQDETRFLALRTMIGYLLHGYFENLFNDISDSITVDRKNMQPFSIRAKMLISANDTFRVEGSSAKDHVIEYELSDHYSADYSPQDEFGLWFFTDWSENEWLSFDNFMMESICLYLKHGVIEAPSINLEKRKKIQHTNIDFVSFMDEKIEKGEIKRGFDYNKQQLHSEFLDNFPEYREDRWLKRSANFTKWLKIYASYSSELKVKITERRSNNENLIRFELTKNEQPQLALGDEEK